MTTIPTVGFNVETVTYKNVKFSVWVSRELDLIHIVYIYIYLTYIFIHTHPFPSPISHSMNRVSKRKCYFVHFDCIVK